ncbi:MAG: serine--tRNA ligase [Archaeoglobaceae archaeon]|nr:serine--tRNA ligase [Archaeoglobaceae archaeon]MDW7989402.1 serine--tRNA ligase [Archaeoglobaceae archaeon]
MMWSIIKALRENPLILYDSQKKRGFSTEIVDRAIDLDSKWREMLKEANILRKKRNELSKLLKEKKDEKIIEEAKILSDKVKKAEEDLKAIEKELEKILLSIPNIAHESVPIGKDENENVAIRYWGKAKVYFEEVDKFLKITNGKASYEISDYRPISHADAVELFGWADIARAGKVAGSRFYYLYDDLLWLDFALTLYAMDFLAKNGFKLVSPPFMLRREAYEGVTAFSDFEEVIYKIDSEDLHLIATSEHAIAAMHMNETLEENELPLLYAGFSPCFRREAGAHGKDTKGIFRVHQFNKVEQFVFCLPDDSWKWHEKLIENAEKLWQGLGIPYRVVNICTGDLGVVAAKKYDLEAWMPSQGTYREMVSCSNCTDWQSYRLKIRYAEKRGFPSKGFVHTLNSTAIATTRAITAIIENYQLEDGKLEIPKVLKKYLENIDSAPKDFIIPKNAQKA